METRTYWDFSQYLPVKWIVQKIMHPLKISIFYDNFQESWCREIRDIKGYNYGGNFIPYPKQLIGYSQKNLVGHN